MVCIISIAQAVGIACSMVPPTSSQAARHSAGRIRFPPARSEYLHAISGVVKGVAMQRILQMCLYFMRYLLLGYIGVAAMLAVAQ